MRSIQDQNRSLNALSYDPQCQQVSRGFPDMSISNNHLTVEGAGRGNGAPSHSHQGLSSNSNFLDSHDSRLEETELSGSVSHNGFSVDDGSYEPKPTFREEPRREKWKNRAEFLLTLIGYTIGLGNVWRFPHLCHKNGGASFLIPYGIMLAIEGIPLYYMELCIGQRMRKGSIGVWNEISPYLGGVGIASVVVCFLVCLYYNVIIAWCIFYFVQSFQDPLPWTSCPTREVIYGNITVTEPVETCDVSKPTEYFWYHTTLGITGSIEETGGMNWKLWGCLVATWLLCWICMMKGIRVTGKIVYLTATLPLVLLIIFFFRGVHLDGYQDGLRLLFVPEFARLKDPLVWLDAAVQIFYSLGVAYGSLIAFSSYNPLKNDSTRDAITVCFINCAVSIYASVVVFCFIGFQAQYRMDNCLDVKHEQILRLLNETGLTGQADIDWEDVDLGIHSDTIMNASYIVNETIISCNKTEFLEMSQGMGLAFIVFTDVITKMPYPSIWAVMFFLMLISVGIDTQFGMLEGVVTPILDMKILPSWKKKHISGAISFILCILGFSMVTCSGTYWLDLIDAYCSGIPLLIIALVECIAISFIYGIDRFSEDIQYMTNKPPRFIWKWCWKVISPLAILAVLSMSIKGMSEKTPSYNAWDAEKRISVTTPLPAWGVFICIMLTLASIFFIPAVAFLKYFGFVPLTSSQLPSSVILKNNTAELQPLYRNSVPRRDRQRRNGQNRAKALRRDAPCSHNHRQHYSHVTNGGIPTAVTANGEAGHVMRNNGNGDIRFL